MTMLGRRKHSRFLLVKPAEGNLRVREEVAVERMTDREVLVFSPSPLPPNEQLTLETGGPDQRRITVKVRECLAAVAADGAIRHRLRLSILEGAAPGCSSAGKQESR
jgi:hypothetical protein